MRKVCSCGAITDGPPRCPACTTRARARRAGQRTAAARLRGGAPAAPGARTPGRTTLLGYGPAHRALREQWAPLVHQGRVSCHATVCLEGSRHIRPGTPWQLGHTADRTAWTGPEHALCNTTDGGRRAHPPPTHPPGRGPIAVKAPPTTPSPGNFSTWYQPVRFSGAC